MSSPEQNYFTHFAMRYPVQAMIGIKFQHGFYVDFRESVPCRIKFFKMFPVPLRCLILTWGPIHKDEKENVETIYLQHYIISSGGGSEILGVHIALK